MNAQQRSCRTSRSRATHDDTQATFFAEGASAPAAFFGATAFRTPVGTAARELAELGEAGDQLELLRQRLARLDARLVEAIARRQRLAQAIGCCKSGCGTPIRCPDREQVKLALLRREAIRHGVETDLVDDVFQRLLAASRRRQHRPRAIVGTDRGHPEGSP